jgi:phosphoserine phosphatase
VGDQVLAWQGAPKRLEPVSPPNKEKTLSLNPRFPLVVFDLDGTLVAHHEPIWKTLHERLGSDAKRRRAVMADAKAGRISYADWFRADLELLRAAGATQSAIETIVDELSPTPGAVELVRELRGAGSAVAVVSGGIDLVRARVLGSLQFDGVHINHIRFSDDGRIAGGTPTAYDRNHKVQGIRALADGLGVEMEQVAFVGDGSNDVHGARAVGCAIAWGPEADRELVEVSDHHVTGGHMDALRPLLFSV